MSHEKKTVTVTFEVDEAAARFVIETLRRGKAYPIIDGALIGTAVLKGLDKAFPPIPPDADLIIFAVGPGAIERHHFFRTDTGRWKRAWEDDADAVTWEHLFKERGNPTHIYKEVTQ